MAFKQTVSDVFRVANGRTVFVGPIESGPSYVGSQTCELLVDGARRQVLELEGEMIPDRPHRQGFRSVSTRSKVELSALELSDHTCILQSLDP